MNGEDLVVTVAWWFLSAVKDRSKLTLTQEKQRLGCDSPSLSGSVLQPLAATLHSSVSPSSLRRNCIFAKTFLLKPAYISQWRVLASKYWLFQVKTHSVETLLNNFRAISLPCRKLVVCHSLTVLFFSLLFQKGSPGKYQNNLRWESHSKLSSILMPWNFKFQKAIQNLNSLYYKKTKKKKSCWNFSLLKLPIK